MTCIFIEFATPLYDESVRLRDKLLRQPLNLQFSEAELSEEWQQYHLVALNEYSEVKGVLVLKPVNKSSIKMRQVAVDESCQRSGVGALMVKASENKAKELGYKKIELSARETAVEFYKKLNYTVEGERFTEVNIPHFKMIKKI